MRSRTGKTLRAARVATQLAFLALFLWLMLGVGGACTASTFPADFFFRIDPLVWLLDTVATRSWSTVALWSAAPVLATLVLGRFFCGWVCPLGTLHHFVSFLASLGGRPGTAPGPRLRRLKYLVLVVVVITAAFGSRFGSLLDPISLLTRSTAVAVLPLVPPVPGRNVAATAAPDPSVPLRPAGSADMPARVRAQVEVTGLLLLGLLLANFVRRRFFCHGLCPLGALYGLLARLAPLRLRAGEDCVECGACAAHCAQHRGPVPGHAAEDCLWCMACAVDCPLDAVAPAFVLGPGRAGPPFVVGRRELFGSLATGAFLAALPGMAPAAHARSHGFLRPPGARAEGDFLERCVRCGACMQACPTSFVQAAGLETGIDGLWTPVGDARAGYCDYGCTRCTTACPTGALEPMSLVDKQLFKIGTAVVDRSRCFTHADGFNCTVCADACPIPARALRFREVEVHDFEGRLTRVNQVYVVPDLCTGCGICEYRCPRSDGAAILVTSEEEQRELAY